MKKSARKRDARALQERTGWPLQECHRVLSLGMTPEALTAYIRIRGGEPLAAGKDGGA